METFYSTTADLYGEDPKKDSEFSDGDEFDPDEFPDEVDDDEYWDQYEDHD